MANSRENVSIFWDSPVNSDGTLYSHIKAYELHHNIPGYPSPLIVPPSITSGGPLPLPAGKYHIAVSTINTEGHKSAKVMTKFEVAKPLINPNAKRGYGIPLGGIISSATTISSGGIFNVTNTSGWAFAGEGAPQVFTSHVTGQTARFEQDCSDIQSLTFSSMSADEQAIKSHYLFYDYSDANDPWKLLKWQDTVYATNNINIGYFWDTATGDDGTDTWTEHVARAFAAKSGTVTLTAGSNEVVGSGTSFSSEYEIGDIILFAGDTQAGVVTYVDTDLSLTIDRTFATAISGAIKRQVTRIDKNYDSAVYTIRKDAGTFKKLAINLTVDTDVFTGQGVRQVNLYKLNDASLTSTTAGTFADPNAGNTDWSQAVPALASNNDKIYVASRTFTSDAASPEDAAWSSPVVYGQRTDGAAGAAGAAGVAGADGDDGAGIEYIFAVTSDSSSVPSSPSNSYGFDQPSSPWFDAAPSITTTNKALWRAQRAIVGNPSAGDSVSDTWTSPSVVGRFGDTGATGLQGVAGSAGDDGAGIEYIFAKTADTSTTPSAPNNAWGFDNPSSPWSDAAPSLDTSNKALWRAQRAILGNPSVGDSVSDTWSSSTVVGRFADDGVDGADGDDGAGIEYIFAVTSDSDTSPSNPSNSWGFDQPSAPWYDGAPAMTTSNKALWRAQRAIVGNPSVGASVSANWSSSSVVGRFADDGADGDDGPQGIQGIQGQTGATGATGPDGEPLRNAQVYFFHNSYQASAPTAPTAAEVAYNFSTQAPTITTSGWSANLSPPALSSDDTGNNKLHAVKVVFQETTYNGAYTETISNVFTWTAFDGLVTFTNLNNATNENGVASATLIDGGGIIAGSIEVDRLSAGSGTISTGREFHLGSGAAIGTADVVMFGKGTSTDMSGVAGLAGSGGIGVGGAAIGATSAGGWFGSAASSNYATTSWNTYCEMATPGKSAVFGGTVDILSGVTSITNLNLGSATNTGDKCLNLKEGAAGSRLSGQISILADSVASTGDSTLALVLDQGVEAVGTYTASHKIKVKINAVEYWLALDAV